MGLTLKSWRKIGLIVAWALEPRLAAGDDRPAASNSPPVSAGPMAAAEAATRFRAPAGFRVTVFAAEPDVQNPIAMAWDCRGRLWVAENYTYSDQTQKFDLGRRDRVLIFEDKDADGHFDTRRVFTEDIQMLASVELGLGGVWLLCPPRLLFLPDRDGDDTPDAPAQVVLDGFAVPAENYHTFANGLRWGPDGWLYGRCGASSPAHVGPPGTPAALRVPVRGGIWRYDARHGRFEALSHGTTNPWGHDWNALGELFFINTVNGHLWHMIPGAHFVRPHTIDPNRRAYAQIDQHADHWHFDHSRELVLGAPGATDSAHGGGHAHSGAAIYLGDQWPAEYRGALFTLNFHGRRMNVEKLERSGSGYIGHHQPDLLLSEDPWFRGIDLSYGPDGSVFILDWSDTGECHERDGVHRASGRIYKVTHGTPRCNPVGDLSRLEERELVALHGHPNEWFVRQARAVLAERAARGEPLNVAERLLRESLAPESDPVPQLRALWSLHAIKRTDTALLKSLLDHAHESMRAWAIRLLVDSLPLDSVFSHRIGPDVNLMTDLQVKFQEMARADPSGLVRLVLASTLQRLPVKQRVGLARALLSRAEDAADHNLPALIWTGLIPLAEADPGALASLASECRLPQVARLIARRLGEDVESQPEPLDCLLASAISQPQEFRAEVVAGLTSALAGHRKAKKPPSWNALQASIDASAVPRLASEVRALNVLFGNGRALEDVRRLALDEKADIETRKAALETLIASRPGDLRSICERLVRVRFLNATAMGGLALFDDPAIGKTLAQNYRSFHPTDRPAALATLVSRPSFARILLDQIASGKIPRRDLTPFHARQILSSSDPDLARKLSEVWGVLRVSSGDRRERMRELKAHLDVSTLAGADRSHGRAIYDRVCGTCHRLYGNGGEIGPDLTGSGRDNLDYLLENIVDPSASVSADFRMVVVMMTDGRVLNGMIKTQTEHTLTLQGQTEAIILNRSEIERIQSSPASLMPDGLLDTLSASEIRDLIAYLSQYTQVPLDRGADGRRPAGVPSKDHSAGARRE
jgi:putative membrane-bound dehydrogenase-like protein